MLQGRARELEELDLLLTDAQAADGRALLLTGEAGIGKTALLDVARERAGEMRVIEVVGIEAEANLPFAALGEVAEPLLDGLGELPPPQSAAVQAALALAPAAGAAGDRLAVCLGFLGLLGAGSRERPLLVLVDDAHWLDSASAECLGYAARRLDGEAVALLAAARTESDRPAPLGGRLPELSVSGLDRGEAMAVLRSGADDLAGPAAETLLDAAQGNPLALLELPALLSEDQRRGRVPVDPVPIPVNGLRDALERRLEALDPEVRAATLVASASMDRLLAPVAGACRELGLADRDLERAEDAGVLELGPERIAFSHPLLRGLVYDSASGNERRRAHGALAKHSDEDARAWHRAAAAVGPDEEVAAALEAAGQRAGARGAHSAAADALERAAQLSEDPLLRSGRGFAAGLAAAMGGAQDRGLALLEPIAADDSSPIKTPVRHLLAMVSLVGGNRPATDNHRMLSEEAERVVDANPAMAATMHADAGVIAVVGADCLAALRSAERAAEVLPADATADTQCHVLSVLGLGLALRGDTDAARDALDRAGELLPAVDPLSPAAQSIAFALHARVGTGQTEQLRAEVISLGSTARDSGVQGLVPYYLLVAADSAYRLGDWAAAERDIAEAIEIAEYSNQSGPHSIGLVVSARLRAARGEDGLARAEASQGMELAEPPGYDATPLWAHAMLGFLELGLGNAEEAIVELEEAGRRSQVSGLGDPVIVPWAPDLIEAYARAGRDDDSTSAAAELVRRAERTGQPLALALAARCDGLVEPEDFDAEFERALEHHDRADNPFERARTLLAWGGRQHRARRRVDARERLREAQAEFERLGAAPWAERARAELRAAGALKRAPVGDPDELTGQEVRVAAAVARGATNREVASELFLSPKTIEFHLGRVYRKLGISSRTELAGLVAEGRLSVAEDAPERQNVGR